MLTAGRLQGKLPARFPVWTLRACSSATRRRSNLTQPPPCRTQGAPRSNGSVWSSSFDSHVFDLPGDFAVSFQDPTVPDPTFVPLTTHPLYNHNLIASNSEENLVALNEIWGVIKK